MKLINGVSVLCLVAAIAMPRVATAHSFGPGGRGGEPLPSCFVVTLRHVNLSDAQWAKVRPILDASSAKTKPLMKQLRAVHDQIAEKLLGSGTLAASDLAPLQQQESQLQQQIYQQMLSAALQVRGILTPEQLARGLQLERKMKALRDQMDELLGDDARQ